MKVLEWGIRIVLVLVVVYSLAISVVILNSTVTANGQEWVGVRGNPPIEMRTYQVFSWPEFAGESGLAGILAFISLIGLSAWAGWTGRTRLLAAGAAAALMFSYVTGFSIGRAYFPSAALLLLAFALIAFRPHPT